MTSAESSDIQAERRARPDVATLPNPILPNPAHSGPTHSGPTHSGPTHSGPTLSHPGHSSPAATRPGVRLGPVIPKAGTREFSEPPLPPVKGQIRDLSFYYGETRALNKVNLTLHANSVTAFIGPSGCGKTTLLRCFNRMHDLYPGNRYEGEILLQPTNENIVSRRVDPMEMRLRVGMVFQKPNPFPKTIFDNVAFGLRLKGIKDRKLLSEQVENALRNAALWDEVKDRLHKSAYELSGGQQQRLCIARALAPNPELLLLDEPTSALDPIATVRIEDLIFALKEKLTIIIVTHNMQQAARVSDVTAFFFSGEVIESNRTPIMFSNPKRELTADYITGRFG